VDSSTYGRGRRRLIFNRIEGIDLIPPDLR